MPYGAYLRRTRRKFRKVSVKATTPVKAKYSYYNKKAVARRGPRATFAQKVNAIISRNNENKFTATLTYNDAVARSTRASSVDSYTFFTWTAGADATGSKLFNLENDAREGYRIGNTIKLKRWVMKGLIEPVVSNTTTMTNSYVGYVDVYFGKLMKNTAPPANTLAKLYQNGAVTKTPTCVAPDMLQPLNKDSYKVYYHRRFKMGAASDTNTYDPDNSAGHPANNDFKISQTFGFDVCKYILKNKHIKYEDGSATADPPNNSDILNLTLWATWTPLTGQATGTGTTGTFKTLYNINALTYAEYEDA